jgi:predicted exporter
LIGPRIAPDRPPRGSLLTVLLVLVTGGSLFGIASTILIFSALHRVAERQIDPTQNVAHAKKILTVMLLASVVRLVCAGGMWMWKQWGVFGYVGLAMLQIFLESRLYPHHQYSYGHLVWVVLVLAAALPKWSQFEA